MNTKRRKKSNANRELKQKKIIRCKLFMKPVFENDSCSKFIVGSNRENNSYCKNCGYSF